ncbi:MAG: hypothetical protein R3F43_12785 [bacterium]
MARALAACLADDRANDPLRPARWPPPCGRPGGGCPARPGGGPRCGGRRPPPRPADELGAVGGPDRLVVELRCDATGCAADVRRGDDWRVEGRLARRGSARGPPRGPPRSGPGPRASSIWPCGRVRRWWSSAWWPRPGQTRHAVYGVPLTRR